MPCGTLTASLDRAFPVKSQASVPPLGSDSKPYEMLTARGGEQLRQLGQRLRERYASHLLQGEKVKGKEKKKEMETNKNEMNEMKMRESVALNVYASNFRRTQQSAQFFLKGFTEDSVPIQVRAKEDCVINAFDRCLASKSVSNGGK